VELQSRSLVIAGTGITSPDGVNVAIASDKLSLINGSEQAANKNVVNGYAGIGADGSIPATLIARIGTAAEINALVLESGEIAWTTDTFSLRLGDGVTAGGKVINVVAQSSTTTITLECLGSAAQNGAALVAAYTAAKLLTPNNVALGARNPAFIRLLAGVYQHTGFNLDSPYVRIIGLGPEFTVIENASTFQITASNESYLKGIRFTGNNDGVTAQDCRVAVTTPAGGMNCYWEDIFLDTNGSTTNNAMSMTGASAANPIGGYFKRVRTVGQRFWGNVAAAKTTALFEDCQAGNQSFFGASSNVGNNGGIFSGTLRRCTITGTAWNIRLDGATAVIEDSYLNGMGILRIFASGGVVTRTRIIPASGPCFSDNVAVFSIAVTHCVLKTFAGASPYGGSQTPTNSVGTSNTVAMNVHSDTAA
jgi:hypothetical protein